MATATPLDLPERSKPRARGRLQLLLILLVVLGPMILATSMYKLNFWVPEGRSYHGAMIGNGESRADLGVAGEDERWQLLVSAPQACAEDCQRLVYLARQIQVGLGRAPNEWLDLDSTEAPTRSCRCQACASPL